MTKENFNLAQSLATGIVAQRRTSSNKQFVFLQGQYAIKGPYKGKRLENVLSRSSIFSAWKTPLIVYPVDSFVCDDGTYIRYHNLMKNFVLTTEEYIESSTGLRYNVIKKTPLPSFNKAYEDNPWVWNNMEDLLVAWCHCIILGVGDTGLSNVLVDPINRCLHLIDYDDSSTKDRDDEEFYFSRKCGKKHNWYSRVGHHYNAVADRLLPLVTDNLVIQNNLIDRVQRVISLLRQHYTAPVSPLEKGCQINDDKGLMIWHGIRGGISKTYSGVSLDVAKSALQKYIRRNIPEKAIMTAIEMYRFNEVGGAAAVTNMYNRLAIIAAEDIGPANLPLVLKVITLVESKNRDLSTLATIVQLLALSPKTRMMSHAWRAYVNPEGRKTAATMGLHLDTQLSDTDVEYYRANYQDKVFLPGDPDNLRAMALIFRKRLLDKDFNAFSWAGFFLQACTNITVTKRKKFIKPSKSNTGKSDIILWYILRDVLPAEMYDILVEAYYNHTENRPFLQLAVLVALYNTPYISIDLEPFISKWRGLSILEDMIKGKYKLEIDDFCIDKHTIEGRRLGKDATCFVNEGALVSPQDPLYYNELLATIYKMQ